MGWEKGGNIINIRTHFLKAARSWPCEVSIKTNDYKGSAPLRSAHCNVSIVQIIVPEVYAVCTLYRYCTLHCMNAWYNRLPLCTTFGHCTMCTLYVHYLFCELQTLNLWISLNHPPVVYTGFWRFMPQSLPKYIGILLSPCSVYRAFSNTGGSYCTCTMCALCIGAVHILRIHSLLAVTVGSNKLNWRKLFFPIPGFWLPLIESSFWKFLLFLDGGPEGAQKKRLRIEIWMTTL